MSKKNIICQIVEKVKTKTGLIDDFQSKKSNDSNNISQEKKDKKKILLLYLPLFLLIILFFVTISKDKDNFEFIYQSEIDNTLEVPKGNSTIDFPKNYYQKEVSPKKIQLPIHSYDVLKQKKKDIPRQEQKVSDNKVCESEKEKTSIILRFSIKFLICIILFFRFNSTNFTTVLLKIV